MAFKSQYFALNKLYRLMDICEIQKKRKYINAEFNFQQISVMSFIQLTDMLAQFTRQLWETCLFMT